MQDFKGFGLPAVLLDTLERMQYTTPTPIQAQAIPLALKGRDILGSAQTGTGKTAAFGIPMAITCTSPNLFRIGKTMKHIGAPVNTDLHSRTEDLIDVRNLTSVGSRRPEV